MRSPIDGATRLMGILGEGIAYTKSPRLHNQAAASLGLNVAYLPVDLPAAQVEAFLHAAWAMQAVGFSVTTPHKALVASLVPDCGLASVNTLYRGRDWWLGASTDGGGFAAGLERLGRPLAQCSRVVILGSGGVVSAVLGHMVATLTKLPELTVLRRSEDHDAALSALWAKGNLTFGPLGVATLRAALAGESATTLLVQATSAPHRGDDLSHLCPALLGFKGVVCDLVYGKPSQLYHEAVRMGLAAQDGEAMLIEQARLAQTLWWGKAASYEEMAQLFGV